MLGANTQATHAGPSTDPSAPNATRVLLEELETYRDTLTRLVRNEDELEGYIRVLDQHKVGRDQDNAPSLAKFLVALNNQEEKKSVINLEIVQRITTQFDRLAYINQAAPIFVHGVLHSAILYVSDKCTGCTIQREVAIILEQMGLQTWEFTDEKLEAESIPKGNLWDALALYSSQVVVICRRLLGCSTIQDVINFDIRADLRMIFTNLVKECEFERNRKVSEANEKTMKEESNKQKQEEERLRRQEEDGAIKLWLREQSKSLSDRHDEYSEKRQHETGEWFVSRVKTWLAQGTASIFWGVGLPGMGKSVLASTVIDERDDLWPVPDELDASGEPSHDTDVLPDQGTQTDAMTANDTTNDKPRSPVAHIYLSWEDRASQNPIPVLASTLLQVYDFLDKARDPLRDLVNKDRANALQGRNVQVLLQELIDVTAALSPKVLLILDALDEANLKTRSMVAKLLRRLKLDEGPRILIMSRPDIEVPAIADIPAASVYKVPIEGSEKDLRKFFRATLVNDVNVMQTIKHIFKKGRLRKELREVAIAGLVNDLVESTNNMFLLASLYVREVCQRATYSLDEMQKAARRRNLDTTAFYERTWKQIETSEENNVELARKIIAWLIFSRRALAPEELTTALAVEPGMYTFNASRKVLATRLQTVCRGLVVLINSGRTVRVAHPTVKEYFTQLEGFQPMRIELSRVCFTYLTTCFKLYPDTTISNSSSSTSSSASSSDSEEEPGQPINPEISRSPSSEWESSEDDADEYPVRQPLRSSSRAWNSDSGFYTDDDDGEEDIYGTHDNISSLDLMEPPRILSEWLPTTSVVKAFRRPFFRYAITSCQWHLKECNPASEMQQGLLEDVLRFIDAAFDHSPNAAGGEEMPASKEHIAVLLRNAEALKCVIAKSWSKSSKPDLYGRTPAMWAAVLNEAPSFRILQQNDRIDFDATDSAGNVLLYYASFLRDDALLGTVVDQTAAKFKTSVALCWAVDADNLILAQNLLRAGIAVDDAASPGSSLSPLHSAIQNRNFALVMLLLNNGAPLASSMLNRDGQGRTPLMAAIRHDLDMPVITRFIDDGTPETINDTDRVGWTALHMVAERAPQSLPIVKHLIRRGCDPSKLTQSGRSALHIFLELQQLSWRRSTTSMEEQLTVAKALIYPVEKMLKSQKESSDSIFHAAYATSNMALLEYLLSIVSHETGSNGLRKALNHLDQQGLPPVLRSLEHETPVMLEYTLERYSHLLNVNAIGRKSKDSYLSTMIYDGMAEEWLDVVMRYCGDLLHHEDQEGWTPLFLAVMKGHLETTEYILRQEGVDLDHRCNGRHIFHQACQYATDERFPLLLLKHRDLDEWLKPKADIPHWHLGDQEKSALEILLLRIADADSGLMQVLDLVLASQHSGLQHFNASLEGPIHIAAMCCSYLVLEQVLSRAEKSCPASINHRTSSEKTALDYALERGDGPIIGLLLTYGALPGLFWNQMSQVVRRWSEETWFSALLNAVQRRLKSDRSVNPRWEHDAESNEEEIVVEEDIPAQPYVQICVPRGAKTRVCRIEFTTKSHDQGWSDEENLWGGSYNASWTWFEAGVQKLDGGCLPRRAIQRNLHAGENFKTHINVWDARSDDQGIREWLSGIKGGDVIQVFPKARFPCWRNYVSFAKIRLWTEGGSAAEGKAQERPKLLRSLTKAPDEVVEVDTEVYSMLRRTTS